MPNIPNTRARASSQSTLGVSESGDLGIARRQLFTDEGTGMTQLLTAIGVDMNKNMTDIGSQLMALTTKCDDISQTCRDLQRENSRLSNQNIELQKKVRALETRIEKPKYVLQIQCSTMCRSTWLTTISTIQRD